MSEINTGGPAFPRPGDFNPQIGMTLRDYFAAKAMQAYITENFEYHREKEREGQMTTGWTDKDIAEFSYEIADAMLKERG